MSDRANPGPDALQRTLPLLRGAAIFIIVAGLRAGRPVLLPLLLAIFIAGLGIPLLDAQLRRGWHRFLAVTVTFTFQVAMLAAVGFLMVRALSSFFESLPTYQELLVERVQTFVAWLEARGVGVSEWWSPEELDFSYLVEKASGIVGGTLRGVTSAASFTLLALVFLLFVLVEATDFDAKLRQALGDRAGAVASIRSVTRNTQRYLLIKTATSAMVGLLAAGATALAGIDFPLIWGMIAFFLHYIPVVGAIIAAVPAVILTLAQMGLARATLVALAYLAINFLIGNLLEPLLMGRPLGLSPLAVLIALAFWGWVWGPIGAVLSVPLTLVIKILLEESGQLRWLTTLLGPAPAGEAVAAAKTAAAE